MESVPDDPVELLPHRPPFRFVDAIDELVEGERVVARFDVAGAEAILAGHFPGFPVFPGVLQIEALAQAGAVAVLTDPRSKGRIPLLAGVEEVRFRRQAVPGDVLTLRVEVERLSARSGWARGVASVEGEECCRARLMFVLAPQGG